MVGPEPKLIVATRDSGTVPPEAVGTGRFSIVAMCERESGGSLTRIGTCRSDSENLALFWSISPWVAMRITWLSACVVTPSCPARSRLGVTISSGRRMSALIRGATSTFVSGLIWSTSCCAAFCSASESEPDSITLIGRPDPPPPPNDWK